MHSTVWEDCVCDTVLFLFFVTPPCGQTHAVLKGCCTWPNNLKKNIKKRRRKDPRSSRQAGMQTGKYWQCTWGQTTSPCGLYRSVALVTLVTGRKTPTTRKTLDVLPPIRVGRIASAWSIQSPSILKWLGFGLPVCRRPACELCQAVMS